MGMFSLRKKAENNTNDVGCTTCGCGDYSTEFADEILLDNYTKGVTFRTTGDTLKLTYNGLLARSGANEIQAVVGYGSNQNWEDVRYYTMNATDRQTFELSIPVKENEKVNIAFKDNANNWDNNSGNNYSFYVH